MSTGSFSGAWINNEWVPVESGDTIEVRTPGAGSELSLWPWFCTA